MNKPLCSITTFLSCATLVFANLASAQVSTTQHPATKSNGKPPYAGPYRYTGGWNVSNSQNVNAKPVEGQSPVVQAAFYQAPGSGMGLPAYPGNDPNLPTNNLPTDGTNVMPPALPAGMPNALPGLPGGQSSVLPGRLSDVEPPNNSLPPQNYQPNYQQVSPPPQQPQFDPYAREQQPVLPPNPMRTASTDLRAVQSNNQQNPALYNPAQYGPAQYGPAQYNQANNQPNNSGNDLRPAAPTMQRGFGPEAQRIDVATGYPFVSPAPRTGNYPTSQYNGSLFRPVSYQTVAQSPQAPLSAAVANTQPTLPQYQNQPVGIYPTQYQCAPGTATYPPPGAVPGTYVPPTLTPNLTPGTYSPNNSGYSPLFSLGQENYNVQLGRGLIGQPTVYVPGQPFRNFIRYLSP